MARPIAKTPSLKGKDANEFIKGYIGSLTRVLSPTEKAKRMRELKEMKKNYKILVEASNGAF